MLALHMFQCLKTEDVVEGILLEGKAVTITQTRLNTVRFDVANHGRGEIEADARLTKSRSKRVFYQLLDLLLKPLVYSTE